MVPFDDEPTLYRISQHLGELHASLEHAEQFNEEVARELRSLREAHARFEARLSHARRQLPDDLAEFIRKEHKKAVAREKFWNTMQEKLVEKGIFAVLTFAGSALLVALAKGWPAIRDWIVRQLSP